MKKLLLSIGLMALLAACGDSGSAPAAPASDEPISSSSVDPSNYNWNKYSSVVEEPAEVDTDSIQNIVVEVLPVCDSFNVDGLNDLLVGNEPFIRASLRELENICPSIRLQVDVACETKSCIKSSLDGIGITISDELLHTMLWEADDDNCEQSIRILYDADGTPYMVRFH